MSAAEWVRPTDEEWAKQVADFMDRAWKRAEAAGNLETIEDVEAQEAEFLHHDGQTQEQVKELFPDVLQLAGVADAGPVEEPLFTNGLRRGDFGLTLGESGQGKSFVQLAIAASLATGEVILPSFTPQGWHNGEQCAVLVVGYEDPAPILRDRLDAIDGTGAWREAEADGLLGFLLDVGPLFEMQGKTVVPSAAGRRLDATMKQFRPDVVIIDPLSGAAVLDDENANAALHRVGTLLVELARKHDCAIILSHHASKGKAGEATQHMARGASALACRARWIMTLTAPPDLSDPDLVQATIVKDSYGKRPAPFLLRREAGGALMEVSYREIASIEYTALAKTFAESLGDNQADWSYQTILKGEACKEFRDSLKTLHAKSATRAGLVKAYAFAVDRGWIVEEQHKVGGSEKRIPRLRKGGINS